MAAGSPVPALTPPADAMASARETEEREKLIDFTDNAPVGFFSVDEDGRFVFANATLARWLGVSNGGIADIFPGLSNFSTADLGFMI